MNSSDREVQTKIAIRIKMLGDFQVFKTMKAGRELGMPNYFVISQGGWVRWDFMNLRKAARFANEKNKEKGLKI